MHFPFENRPAPVMVIFQTTFTEQKNPTTSFPLFGKSELTVMTCDPFSI